MSLSEFDLIGRYFAACGATRRDVLKGVGDDAALLRPPSGMELAVTQDTLVCGVHFFPDVDPVALGHKALAVNLSDLAAMGADPAWVTLGLTLPDTDEGWLQAFSHGFAALARASGVSLIGGDTTRGPLSLSVTAMGWVPAGQALRRDGARPGEGVWVSGTLGDAGLALRALQDGVEVSGLDYLRSRLERPQPRLALGKALRGIAGCAIDISDGLAADLGHILQASAVGAELNLSDIPCSQAVEDYVACTGDWSVPLASGDDYELCFTLAEDRSQDLQDLIRHMDCPVTHIGRITREPGLRLRQADGNLYTPQWTGFEHFDPHV